MRERGAVASGYHKSPPLAVKVHREEEEKLIKQVDDPTGWRRRKRERGEMEKRDWRQLLCTPVVLVLLQEVSHCGLFWQLLSGVDHSCDWSQTARAWLTHSPRHPPQLTLKLSGLLDTGGRRQS